MNPHRLWARATEIRTGWLASGLCTKPADRTVAELAITGLYARVSRPRPRFVWVPSPRAAVPLLTGLPTHAVLQAWLRPRSPAGPPPVMSDLVAARSRLHTALDEGSEIPAGPAKKPRPDPGLPPTQALDAGVPLRQVLLTGVRHELEARLHKGFAGKVRASLGPVPVAWYGQQDAGWIAHADALRQLGLARYRPSDEAHLEDWAAVARSAGWWWPGEDVCVVTDRPAGTTPVPAYRDGWSP